MATVYLWMQDGAYWVWTPKTVKCFGSENDSYRNASNYLKEQGFSDIKYKSPSDM